MHFYKAFILLAGFLYCSSAKGDERDSLLHLLNQKNISDTAKVRLMNLLSEEFYSKETYDTALVWCDSAINFSQKLQFIEGEARSIYQKGKLYLYHEKYALASDAFLKAQELFKSIHHSTGIADCFLQTGVLMYVQKNYNEALKNFREAAPLYKSVNNLPRAAKNQYLYGLTLSELGEFHSALPELLSALASHMNMNDEQGSMECRMAIAHVYYKTGNYSDAIIFYRFGLDHFQLNNNPEGLIVCLTGIGNVLAAQNQDAEAEENFLKAFEIAQKLQIPWRTAQVTEPLCNLYKKRGDYERAFEFQRLFHEAKDSLYNEQNMQAMAGLMSKMEIAKKQTEIDDLSLKEKFAKKIRIGLGIITILLIALLGGLLRRAWYRKKVNEKLSTKNKELDATLKQLKSAEQQLIKAEKMAVFGKLSAGIAHEIRNPLNFITNFSELSEQIADDFIHSKDESEREEMAQQLKKLVDKIGYHGRRADSIVTRMLQHSRTAHTEMELTDINRLADEFSDLAYESMRNLITNFECRLEKNFDATLPKVWLVPQDLSRVIINLLNNAFYAVHDKKHLQLHNYSPQVTINTSQSHGKIILKIHDNGAGIPEDVKAKVFEPFFTTKPMGEGTGLGLSICADIIKAAHGEISVESSEETGTTFTVVFPSSATIINSEQDK